MNSQDKTPGIALHCDREGIIREILQDTLGPSTVFQTGKHFLRTLHEGSQPKGLNFLTEIRTSGKAIDWEFFIPIKNKPECIHFSGILTGKDFFLIGAKDLKGLDILTSKWESMGFAESRQVRSQESAAIDEDTFDQLTVLYNEMSNLQRQIFKKSVELEKLSEQKDHFLSMAAHELRHPLGIIQMLSDFLLEETAAKLTPENVEYIKLIKSNSASMQKLVDDFLDIAIIQRGKLHLKKEPIDLVEIFQKNIALHRLVAKKKRIDLELTRDGKIPQLMADPNKIEQVLNNLISNALKYSPSESQVQVHLRHSGNHIIFEVRDQGYGIPDSFLPKLFEAFEKSESLPDTNPPGAGLGLAIAKKIVEAHEGKIQVKSEFKKGSAFRVFLPVKINSP
jgi:signal transduction histidine kinase